MTKTLFVLNDFANLSHNQIHLRTIKALPKTKYKIHIFGLKAKGSLHKDFKNIKQVVSHQPSTNIITNILFLHRLIKKHHFRLIQTHNLRSDYAVFLNKLFLKGFIHISNKHNFFFQLNSLKSPLKNLFYIFSCHLADLNICVGKNISQKLIQKLKVSPKKVITIANSVSVKKQIKKKKAKKPTILFTGRLVKRKNLLALLRSLKIIDQDFLCLLVGRGPEKKALQKYILKHNLQNKIKLVGFKSDVTPYLKAADIFVLPSLNEGLSKSLLEAMSCGLACIVSNIDSNTELIKHQKNGLVFDLKKGEKDLSKNLQILLKNATLRKKLGQKARKTILKLKNYTEKQMLEKYLRVFQKLA